MAKARAIVKRLKAIKNIRKITRTMELIATARFKKAMDRASEAAAYTRKIGEIVADLARSAGDAELGHPLLATPPATRNVTLLVLTSNRGLCGGYNGGVLRPAVRRLQEIRAGGAAARLEVAGKRGLSYMRFQAEPVAEGFTNFDDRPRFDEAEALADRYVAEFVAGRLDRLDVAYTRFVSASRQTPVVETLLPLGDLSDAATTAVPGATTAVPGATTAVPGATTAVPGAKKAAGGPERVTEYEFVPSAQDILQEIVPAAFKARLFKCFLDAAVSEQIARMVAMKGATENAGNIIDALSQKYNRARQSQITSELAEIIGGAAALE